MHVRRHDRDHITITITLLCVKGKWREFQGGVSLSTRGSGPLGRRRSAARCDVTGDVEVKLAVRQEWPGAQCLPTQDAGKVTTARRVWRKGRARTARLGPRGRRSRDRASDSLSGLAALPRCRAAARHCGLAMALRWDFRHRCGDDSAGHA